MVITSALHAEGREFDPRLDLSFESAAPAHPRLVGYHCGIDAMSTQEARGMLHLGIRLATVAIHGLREVHTPSAHFFKRPVMLEKAMCHKTLPSELQRLHHKEKV